MALRYLREVAGARLPEDLGRWIFVGDAPNDMSMFGAFPLSIGVANILRLADRLPTPPAYVTEAASAAGFVELARHLLDARR